jgi:LuxR family transcriptional regulator, regulator of acetate metabolism
MGGRPQSEMLAHVEALSRLADEHQDLTALLDRCAVLREVSHRIREQTGLDLGYAAELDSPDLLVIRGWAGAISTGLRSLEVPRGLGLGGKSFALERPVWVPDYCSSSAITHEFDSVIRAEGIGAMAAVPLVYDGDVLGVAYAAHRAARDVGDVTLAQMEQLAAPAATALHLADRVVGQTAAALAAERQRIVVALHDSVGAMLFNIGAEVHDLQTDELAAPELLARLRSVERRIADTAAAFRESLAVLDVVNPDQVLTATMRGDCEAFAQRTGVVARCVALTNVPALDGAQCAAIVAVVREALVNVEKHAAATSVVVSVAATDGGLTVAVADNGLGWNDAADAALADQVADGSCVSRDVNGTSTGIGLKASYDRLARVGGALSVVGNEDGGLTVRAWVPMP